MSYIGRFVAAGLVPRLAFKIYWTMPYAKTLHTAARKLGADLYIANDWPALPVAARLAREHGGCYAYDSHEFATEEKADSQKWRLLHRPYITALERHYIGGATVISTVSNGIAERLQAKYGLRDTPLVIRNTPPYVAIAPRTTGTRMRVLYHGGVVAGRGLEAAIDSVAFWRPEFDFTIRGLGAPDYIATLRARIEARNLATRVALVPPVATTDLVREAAAFDIGFHALPGHSHNNVLALPNKIFEYTMAGLALCVSDLPEMARLIRQYGLGITFASLRPEDIARAINALDRGAVDRFRAAALGAAKELCWEREAERMVNAYHRALANVRGTSGAAVDVSAGGRFRD